MIKQGVYPEMPEKDYRQLPALNYSSLADFNESQDHALMIKPAKSYYEEGTAFELLVEDRAKGTTKFAKRFFLADAPGDMPEDLAGWIDNKEDLSMKYRLKIDGDRNNQSKRLHAWLDACALEPGKMPMGTDQVEMLGKMVDNFMLMKPLEDIGVEETLEEILPIAQFQVPIVWYVGKMRKKALVDCMVETDTAVYLFDIKTAANWKKFKASLNERYWVQEVHYSSGIGRLFPGKDVIWRFLVAPKAEPWVAQPAIMDKTSVDTAWNVYADLCEAYQEWLDDGRPPKGWKGLETVKVWFN